MSGYIENVSRLEEGKWCSSSIQVPGMYSRYPLILPIKATQRTPYSTLQAGHHASQDSRNRSIGANQLRTRGWAAEHNIVTRQTVSQSASPH